jgi:hypothetical protein
MPRFQGLCNMKKADDLWVIAQIVTHNYRYSSE